MSNIEYKNGKTYKGYELLGYYAMVLPKTLKIKDLQLKLGYNENIELQYKKGSIGKDVYFLGIKDTIPYLKSTNCLAIVKIGKDDDVTVINNALFCENFVLERIIPSTEEAINEFLDKQENLQDLYNAKRYKKEFIPTPTN